jgi:uncharacterized protein YndB with AHSA1/START domain
MVATSGTATVEVRGDTQIVITREFDAPRGLVWRAYTEPDLIARWWAGDRGRVTSIEVDLRVGGSWRYVMVANDGTEVAFHGEYREIVPAERLVSTEVFEMVPDDYAVDTATFEETDGRTRLSVLVEHTNREARDMHIASGMEVGLQEAMDHLERVAISLV